MVERSDFRKRGFKEEELLRADSALIIHSEIWGGAGGVSGTCTWYMLPGS